MLLHHHARNLRPNPLTGTSSSWQAEFVFVVDGLGADLRLKQEQAALKGMNEEQTASLKTALLHAARDALAVRTQMRTGRRGSGDGGQVSNMATGVRSQILTPAQRQSNLATLTSSEVELLGHAGNEA
jgi:pyocin large subunit-like protein